VAENKIALKMVVDGKERDVTFEELALSNNLAQEALVRLLIEKKMFTADELLAWIEKVKQERYREMPNTKE
jgi:hypothetical protein